MSVEDRLRAARSALSAATREQREQRGLRERHVAEAATKAKDGFAKEVDAAGKYADKMEQLNRKQKEAGGWATEKTLTERSHIMGFGAEDESGEQAAAQRPVYPPTRPAEPAPEPTPPPEPPAVETPAPVRRPARHARRQESFDDDDFSNNSWMK